MPTIPTSAYSVVGFELSRADVLTFIGRDTAARVTADFDPTDTERHDIALIAEAARILGCYYTVSHTRFGETKRLLMVWPPGHIPSDPIEFETAVGMRAELKRIRLAAKERSVDLGSPKIHTAYLEYYDV